MKIRFYSAAIDDAAFFVPLVSESSGGVWPVVWRALAKKGESVEESAIRYLTDSSSQLSVNNTILADIDGSSVGAMITYQEPYLSSDELTHSALPKNVLEVLAPYRMLRDPESLFIAEICCLADSRGLGLGTQFLEYAKRLARQRGLPRVSLRVFSDNLGAVRLYERNGFSLDDEKAVVPHPDITINGTVKLMSCPV